MQMISELFLRAGLVFQQLPYSQSAFAYLLNVSPKTVQAWEQGLRSPSDAALKLLAIAEKHPEVLLDV
jgi:putative transcriptional regulator